MVFEDNSKMRNLFDSIEKFVIIKGRISTDPTIYEYHFKGMQVIRVCAEKSDSPREFRKQYHKVMYVPAVRCSNSEWDELHFELVKKRTLRFAAEESQNVFVAREIFGQICDFEVSTLLEDALRGQALYDNSEHYCLTSRKIRDIVDTSGFRITFKDLSSTMTELGF